MIVSDRFDLSYYVSSLSRFLDAPQVGHIDLYIRVFGYLKKYPKRGYSINPQPLNVDVEYDKVQMKYDFGNQYTYSNENIDDQ